MDQQPHWFRDITAQFIILAPLLILAVDFYIEHFVCPSATITAVVRQWSLASSWPKFVYVVGTVVLYLHLFEKWPQ
jgi:hypothetical protein